MYIVVHVLSVRMYQDVIENASMLVQFTQFNIRLAGATKILTRTSNSL